MSIKRWQWGSQLDWRGQKGSANEKTFAEYYTDFCPIKEEVTHDGRHKLIPKTSRAAKSSSATCP